MPTLNLFTNVPVDAVVASDILKDCTKAVAKIIGKPESVGSLLPSPFSLHTHLILLLFLLVFLLASSWVLFVFVMGVTCLMILLYEYWVVFSITVFVVWSGSFESFDTVLVCLSVMFVWFN